MIHVCDVDLRENARVLHPRAIDVDGRVALVSTGRAPTEHDPRTVVAGVGHRHCRNARAQAVENIARGFEPHHDCRAVRSIRIDGALNPLVAGARQQRAENRAAREDHSYLPLRVHTPTSPHRAPYMLELNWGGVSDGLYTSTATTSSTEM